MGLFRDRWDSENYPSYEDYMEAKRNGTLNKNRQYINTPTSSERKANLSSPAPHVADEKYHTLESQTASIEAKTRAADVETKAADAKRFRDTSSKYGEAKPFIGRLPKIEGDKKKNFKAIAIIIALVVGILPSFSKILDSIAEDPNVSQWIESLSGEKTKDTLGTETTVAAEEILFESNITTALPADHFKLSNELFKKGSVSIGEIENVVLGNTTTFSYGLDASAIPYLKLNFKEGITYLFSNSNFMKSTEKLGFFNEDGTLMDTSYIEFVFTDLTNDGYSELLVYYYSDTANPYVEVFYNTGSETGTYKPLDYFESYVTLNITEEGIIQRIDDAGEIYDEIEITADGVYLIEN